MTNQPGRPPVPPLPGGIPPLPPSLGAEDRAELSAPAEAPRPASRPGLPPTPPMPGTPTASSEAPDAVARAATLPAPSPFTPTSADPSPFPPSPAAPSPFPSPSATTGAPAAHRPPGPSSALPHPSSPHPSSPHPASPHPRSQRPLSQRPPKPGRTAPRPRPVRSASAPRSRSTRLLALLALAAGTLALIGSFIPFVNEGAWLLGVAGVALGVLVLARHLPGRAIAAGGIVTGGLALLVSAVMLLVFSTGLLGQLGGGAAAPGTQSTAVPDAASGEVVPARFGQTVTYDDGLQVQVSAPSAYTPAAGASGTEGSAIVVTITVYNGTSDPFQPAFSSRVTAAGQDATPVDDPSSAVLGAAPTAAVPPGEAVSWQEAYSVASGTDPVPAALAYEIAPTDDYYAARFTE